MIPFDKLKSIYNQSLGNVLIFEADNLTVNSFEFRKSFEIVYGLFQ